MATARNLPISVSEYLHTSYQPDCDYVDGVIEERNLGELDDAAVQDSLLAWFSHIAKNGDTGLFRRYLPRECPHASDEANKRTTLSCLLRNMDPRMPHDVVRQKRFSMR